MFGNDLTTRWGRWAFFGGGRGLAGSKKTTKSTDPIPTPTDIDIEARRKAEDVRRKLKARAGRVGTILTEGDLGVADISKSVLLGGGG